MGSCYIFTFSLGDNQIIEETNVAKKELKLPGNTDLQINKELGKSDLGLSKNVSDRELKNKVSVDTLKNSVKSTKRKVRSKKKRVPNKQYNCRECKEKFE